MKRKTLNLSRVPGNPYLQFVECFDGERLIDRLWRDRDAAMAAGHDAVFRMLCWLYEAHRKYNADLPAGKVETGGSPFGGSYQVLERWLNAKGFDVRRRTVAKPKSEPRGSGLVYFITAGDDRFVKIGFTGDIKGRLKSFATGSPHEITVLLELPGREALERELHKRFAADRLRPKGEWFHLSDDIKAFIEAEKAKQAGN